MQKFRIFYSWQSDLPGSKSRNLMALLQVSIEKDGNHPGIIIFDEPAQQSIVPEDMKSFIDSAVEIHAPIQIIAAITLNSQELIEIIDKLDPSSHHKISIEGKAFKLYS